MRQLCCNKKPRGPRRENAKCKGHFVCVGVCVLHEVVLLLLHSNVYRDRLRGRERAVQGSCHGPLFGAPETRTRSSWGTPAFRSQLQTNKTARSEKKKNRTELVAKATNRYSICAVKKRWDEGLGVICCRGPPAGSLVHLCGDP